EAEEKIGPRRTSNRAARILSDEQVPKLLSVRQLRGDEDGHAKRMKFRVDGNARARGQRNASRSLAAQRRIADRRFLEEDIGLVRFHDLAGRGRICLQPGANGLHGNRLAGQDAQPDQPGADGAVGSAVLRRIRHANRCAIVERNPTRTLDVKKENRDRIVAIEEHARRRRKFVELGPRRIGNQMLVADASGDAFSLPLRPERAKIRTDEVARRGIDRRLIRVMARPAALQQRLVIACDEGFAANFEGGKMIFEEFSRRILSCCEGRAAYAEPILGATRIPAKLRSGLRSQDRAARSAKGRKCRALVEGGPAGKPAERDRRQLQPGRLIFLVRQPKPGGNADAHENEQKQDSGNTRTHSPASIYGRSPDVATRSQFGSRERTSRANVQTSVTSRTVLESPSMTEACSSLVAEMNCAPKASVISALRPLSAAWTILTSLKPTKVKATDSLRCSRPLITCPKAAKTSSLRSGLSCARSPFAKAVTMSS